MEKKMTHCKHCPECAGEMEWKGFYYYCKKCDITQFPYSAFKKVIAGVSVIALITIATLLA